ncbi:MAG TPA: RcnB family protein [Caulobacteraceae bacterium]
MKALILALTASALVAGGAGSASAYPDQHNDHSASNQHAGWGQDRGGSHQWRRGERMGRNDWSGAQPVDYRSHHLSRPRRGYEWRESNGRYVMAAVATGVIASIVLANQR